MNTLNKVCSTCGGEKWVCENHTHLPWNSLGCECGAGQPCDECNFSDRNNSPENPPSFREIKTLH